MPRFVIDQSSYFVIKLLYFDYFVLKTNIKLIFCKFASQNILCNRRLWKTILPGRSRKRPEKAVTSQNNLE